MLSGKGKKWFLIILGVTLFLLITAQSLVHLFVEPSIEAFVKELIELRSDSQYKVESLEVNWNLTDRTIYIDDLHIQYNSEKVRTEDANPENVFTFTFPHTELRHIFIREYLASGKLHAERLYIEAPDIKCVHADLIKKNKKRETKRLYDQISAQIKTIQIDEFELKGGKIAYNDQKNFKRNSFVADQLNFTAQNVLMDSTSGNDFLTWFRVGEADLEINVDKYIHKTADSIYVLKVGKIGLSSTKNELFVEDLHIEPNFTYLNPDQKNLFEVIVPRLIIQGVRPREAAINRELNLGAVRLISPTIVQIGGIQTDSVREDLPDTKGLYEQVKPYIKSLYIDGLSVEKGSYYKVREHADTNRMVALTGIGLYMQNIALDSTAEKNKQKLLLSDELELKVDAYKLLLSENTYSLEGKDARISSVDKRIEGTDIHVHPLAGTRDRLNKAKRDILDLEVPLLEIEGVDLSRLWFRQVLEVSQIRVHNPDLGLTNYPKLEQAKIDEITEQDYNKLIQDYLNILSVRKLDIIDGNFDFSAGKDVLGDGFNASNLGVTIRNFRLNPRSQKEKSKPFYADDVRISLEVDDYSLTLPDSSYSIQVKHLGIATSDSSIIADSIYFTPLTRKGEKRKFLSQVFIPHSYFKGLDIYKSYFQQEFLLDSLNFTGAQIHLTDNRLPSTKKDKKSLLEGIDLYKSFSQSVSALTIRKMALENSCLEINQQVSGKTFEFHHLDLDILNFKVDSNSTHKDALLYAENIELNTKDYVQNLGDSIHQLNIESLALSTQEGDVHLTGFSILPRQTATESVGQSYRVRVPEMAFKGIDLFKLLDAREAQMTGIRIDTPTIELERYPDIAKEEIDSIAKSNLFDFISGELNTLGVGEFIIHEGKLKVNDYTGGTNEFNAANLNLQVMDFQLDSTSAARTDNLFYAQHIELGANVEDYFFVLPDSSYALRIGNVGISTTDSSIYAKNIRLLPQWEAQKLKDARIAWEIDIPELSMAGIDPDEWYFHKKLDLGKLALKNPVIRQVFLHPDADKKAQDLYKILHPSFDLLSIHDLQVKNATFLQERLEEDDKQPNNYRGVDVQAKNFTLDSLGAIRKDRFFYSDDLRLRVDRHAYPFQDSLYTFTFKEFRFSTQDKFAVLDSVNIIPNFEIVDFVMRKGYAQNRMYLQTHDIRWDDLDMYKLLEEGKLWADNMTIRGLDFRVNKDQRFRMQPGRRPPFPQEMIRDIPIPVNLSRISVKGGAVNFQTKTSFRKQAGRFFLTNINATIRFLCNDQEFLENNPLLTTTFEAEATLMNSGKLKSKFLFLLDDTLNSYSFTGNVSPWDMTELNPIMIPAGRIRIKQGKIKKAEFEVFGDKYESRGSMMLRYNDLKVSVLDEKGGEQEALKRRPLVSAIANSLVVKQNNPNRRFLRYGKILYTVDPEKGFVHHWVQSVLSGVKSSVGMEEVEKKDKKGGLKFLKKKKAIP